MNPIQNLFSRLRAWHEDPDSPIDSSLDARLPPPEIVWTLLALIRYRERVHFAARLFRTNVQSALDQQAGQAVDIKYARRLGVVPNEPGWLYELDGNASLVRNRRTGEEIWFDILNGPELISRTAFMYHSLLPKKLGPIEQRMRQLFPRKAAMEVAIEAIGDLGLTQPVSEVDDFSDPEFDDFEIRRHVLQAADAVNAFVGAWSSSQDLSRLGLVIGDWSVCREAALAKRDLELAAKSAPLVEPARQSWLTIIRYQIGKGCKESQLTALLDAGADDARVHVVAALADRDTAGAALDALGDDAAWCSEIYKFFGASVPDSNWPYLATNASQYLLRHDYRKRDVIAGLKSKSGSSLSYVLETVIDFAPDEIGDFLHIALRSPDRRARLTAAAILALHGASDARRFLTMALLDTDDPNITLECRTALRYSQDPAAVASVVAWEAEHLGRAESATSAAQAPDQPSGEYEGDLQRRMQALTTSVQRNRHDLADAIARWCCATENA